MDKLTKTIDDLIESAQILELNKGEGKRLMTIRSKHIEEKTVLDIEEDDLALMALELEDDDISPEPEKADEDVSKEQEAPKEEEMKGKDAPEKLKKTTKK